MATIQQHYENVKDDNLRKELLENLEREHASDEVDSLEDAIYEGFDWPVGKAKYWMNIAEQANDIELINNSL